MAVEALSAPTPGASASPTTRSAKPVQVASSTTPLAAVAKPATKRLFNPVVDAAGTFKADKAEVHLAGIKPTDPDRHCGDGAAAWPCGRLARSELRSFIHGRAIECEVTAGEAAIPDPARCLVGGDDIAAWLVAQGWAEADGDTYTDAAKAARDGKRGLFASARPDRQPAEIAATR